MNRIGLLGGTFDPIHLGHLIPAMYAFNHLRLDRLLLIPSASPVHRPRHRPAPAADRLHMCRLAAASLPAFEASPIEVEREEPSFTVLTLRRLRDSLSPDAELVLLVGEDNLPTLHTWHEAAEVFRLATVALLPRPGCPEPDVAPLRETLGEETLEGLLSRRVPTPEVPVSATAVRTRAQQGRSVAGLVPASVAAYIAEAGLYAAEPEQGP
jgi:nicotinate-nucleotide adenylyltransferase